MKKRYRQHRAIKCAVAAALIVTGGTFAQGSAEAAPASHTTPKPFSLWGSSSHASPFGFFSVPEAVPAAKNNATPESNENEPANMKSEKHVEASSAKQEADDSASSVEQTPAEQAPAEENLAVNETEEPLDETAALIEEIIATGKTYFGTPYEFGSNRSTVDTFDCSDFVKHIFKEVAGIQLPSNSRTQADFVKEIGETHTDWEDLTRGDLMFFMSYKGSKEADYKGIDKSKQRISHVGIYLGDGKILHTYSEKSGGVRIDDFTDRHWEYRFVVGGSAIPSSH
ncbi:C40 family peptidase [Marinicrinis sediminis]|uniref:C40 family peptidase n=1 Tax=Marinicrinis sediminis TaxID=1652465 RepID=A0ABW5RF21_9BACL